MRHRIVNSEKATSVHVPSDSTATRSVLLPTVALNSQLFPYLWQQLVILLLKRTWYDGMLLALYSYEDIGRDVVGATATAESRIQCVDCI
jgi:hypothetical protein